MNVWSAQRKETVGFGTGLRNKSESQLMIALEVGSVVMYEKSVGFMP